MDRLNPKGLFPISFFHVEPWNSGGAAKNSANHFGCTSASTIVPPMQYDTTTFIPSQCVLYFVQGEIS